MAAAGGYSLSIKAIDNVSGVLDRINAKIAASQAAATKQVQAAFAPWQRLGQSIGQTSKLLGVNKLAGGLMKVSTGFREMAGHALDAFRNVARIVEPLGLIAGALSIAGIYKLATAFAQFGTQLKFSATNIGIGVTQLQGLQGAAQLAGVSAGALTTGLQGLGQTLYDAAGGRNTEAVALFTQLGISWRDGVGHAKSVMQVLPQLADKIAAMKDPYAQAQAAQIAFGGAAEDMLPFLRLGSKGIAEYNAAALKYGTITAKQAQAANDLRMSQVKLDLAVHGFVNTLSAQLAPVLTPILTWMADWIAANRQWLAQKISDEVGRLVTWLKGVDWSGVGTRIKGVWSDISDVVNEFGGWKDAAIGMVAVMGASWVASIVAPFVIIGTAIAGVILKVASLAASLRAVPAQAATAETAASAAGRAIGPNFLRNIPGPLGLALQVLLNGLPDGPQVGSGQDDALMRQFPGLSGVRSYGGGLPSSGPLETSEFKNNNPTNLEAYPGQNYATGANGRWATYKTVADGIAGGLHQMLIDQDRGYNTIAKEITRRSPPSENDTAGMIKSISGWMGNADPNKVYNLRDRAQAAAFLKADIRRETGHVPTDAEINKALDEELGPAPAVKLHTALAQNQITPVAKSLGFAGGPGRSPSGPRRADDHTGMILWHGQWWMKPTGPVDLHGDVLKPDAVPNFNDPIYHRKYKHHGMTPAEWWAQGGGVNEAPEVPMPATGSTGAGGSNGKVDVNVKISHDGSIKTTTTTKGQNVNKPRVQTPMPAHAA
jgi:hypothetical protein